MIIEEGTITRLQELIRLLSNNPATLKNLVWTLSNLVRGKPAPDFIKIRQTIPIFASMLFNGDYDIELEACQSLMSLSGKINTNLLK